jgi:hypothetical protein
MDGTIVALLTAVAAGEPMATRPTVTLVPGVGIAGDRYATKRGLWSDPKWTDQELTLIDEALLDELGLSAEQLRRNIVTRGVRLDDLIGVEFRIGEATLLGVRKCDPCKYIEGFTRSGLLKELAGRGGLRAHVITGGAITVGERLARVASSQPGD